MVAAMGWVGVLVAMVAEGGGCRAVQTAARAVVTRAGARAGKMVEMTEECSEGAGSETVIRQQSLLLEANGVLDQH